MSGQTIHEVSMEDANDGRYGVCRKCGNVQYGAEPDARNYECEECGEMEVFGIAEAIMGGWATFGGDE